MNILFLSMTRREKYAGWVLGTVGLLTVLLLRMWKIPSATALCVLTGLLFFAVLWIFRRFLEESFQIPFTGFGKILKTALLGLMAAQLFTLLMNDLLYFFFPKYFSYGDTGPQFIHPQRLLLAEAMHSNGPVTWICTVLLLPVVTEVFHRGLLFGSVKCRSRSAACLISTSLIAFLRICFLPQPLDPIYTVICFLQYIPMGIFFTWIYTSTETILTPILAHMLLNAVSITTMR